MIYVTAHARDSPHIGSEHLTAFRESSTTSPVTSGPQLTTGYNLAPDLRTWIEAAVGNSLTLQQLNGLVELCHSMAAVGLRRRIAPVLLDSGVHGTNYRDLAYDCIAELFQRGEDGSLLQIRAYFQGIERAAASDQELLTHLRRIVFTKVNHGVVRFYGEADPDLGKILRNIKLSIQALRNFSVVGRFGDTFLLPAFSPSLEHLPPFSREELERALRKDARPDEHVPALLAHLSRILRAQRECSRLVSLTTVALAIKSIYLTPATVEPAHEAAGDPFTVPEIMTLVQTACREVLGRMAAEYVDSGKVERDMFRKYIEVVEKNVALRFTGEESDGHSLFSGLQSLVPSLSEAEYRATHRARLEYLSRLAYKRSVEILRINS